VSDATGRRAERVAERIRIELMDLLVRGVVRDPQAADCFVTAVRVSDDLRSARVWVRKLQGDGGIAPALRGGAMSSLDDAARERAVEALNRAAGFLRRELAPRLRLRHQPELRFVWDEGEERAARIEALLAEDRPEDRS
jgi:ribosome-binding factor A